MKMWSAAGFWLLIFPDWRHKQMITTDIVSIKGDKAIKAGDFTLIYHIY